VHRPLNNQHDDASVLTLLQQEFDANAELERQRTANGQKPPGGGVDFGAISMAEWSAANQALAALSRTLGAEPGRTALKSLFDSTHPTSAATRYPCVRRDA
jgi:hypothetical protein